jgi:hypothetical protein
MIGGTSVEVITIWVEGLVGSPQVTWGGLMAGVAVVGAVMVLEYTHLARRLGLVTLQMGVTGLSVDVCLLSG